MSSVKWIVSGSLLKFALFLKLHECSYQLVQRTFVVCSAVVVVVVVVAALHFAEDVYCFIPSFALVSAVVAVVAVVPAVFVSTRP